MTRIAWNIVCSVPFSAFDGIKEDSYFSPVLFCIRLGGVLFRLSESKIGCYIGNVIVSALECADDIAFIAPTARATRVMIGICNDFARDDAIVFHAKKSKCLWA